MNISALIRRPYWISHFRFCRYIIPSISIRLLDLESGGDTVKSYRNLVAITSESRDMTIFASAAAILEFPHPVWSYSIPSVSVRLLDLENGGIAIEVLSLWHRS